LSLAHSSKLAWLGMWLLLLGGALLFPSTAAAGLALLGLVAITGAGLAAAAPHVRVKPPAWAPDVIIALVIGTASVLLFRRSWNDSGLRIYDWAAHHANLRHLVDGLRDGHIPAWVHGVSTGESPYELYAFLPYYLAAKAALLTNTQDLTLVMVRSAILIHSLAAISAGLLSRRVVRWPFGIVVGLTALYDIGSVWGGGIDGLFAMGVTHSALAQAVWSCALIALLAWLKRPGLWRAACVWALVALAIACHPLAIISALATLGALLLVAVLARDVAPERALIGVLHVAIGLCLVAFVWMPFSERLLLYGVHYGIPPALAWEQFAHMLSQPVPETSSSAAIYAGYLGVLVAVLSRRAAPTLLACFASILMAGTFDQVYSLLDLVPSLETARFQMVRLPSSAKVALYVCGVYLLDTALTRLRSERSKPSANRQRVLAALLALGAFGVVRSGLPYLDRFQSQVRALAFREVPDSAGLRELAAWAAEQNRARQPDRYGRLLDEDERRTFLVYHVHAESGLPSLWLGPTQPLFFLRERMEDSQPHSLRRFNVRWVMRADRAPALGDPATERRFGRYFVRELPEWDGKFARVERGHGTAKVTHFEDERVEVELSGTNEPALVALGMGYYPRWQATHEADGALPVYALPAFEGARLHVPGAWLPPGRTTFSPWGALPSDGKGRLFSACAALLALCIGLVWGCLPSWRARVLRGMARAARALRNDARPIGWSLAGVLVLASFVLGLLGSRRPAAALQVGNGLRAGARVDVRSPDGSWRSCAYAPFYGAYRCPGQILVQDGITSLLNDAPPSLPFNVPAIHVAAAAGAGEVRVSLKARLLGEYWAGSAGGRVKWAVSGEPVRHISGEQTAHLFEAVDAEREITLTFSVPAKRAVEASIVQSKRLSPERASASAPELPPPPGAAR
jgi:hypothetical protein